MSLGVVLGRGTNVKSNKEQMEGLRYLHTVVFEGHHIIKGVEYGIGSFIGLIPMFPKGRFEVTKWVTEVYPRYQEECMGFTGVVGSTTVMRST